MHISKKNRNFVANLDTWAKSPYRIMNGIEKIGEYFLLMGRVFRTPDRWRMFWRQMSKEMEKLEHMLCDELDKIAQQGELTSATLPIYQ